MSTHFLSRNELPAHTILSTLGYNGFRLLPTECTDDNWVWTDGNTFVHSSPITGTERASFTIFNRNYMPESLQADLDLLSEHDDDYPMDDEDEDDGNDPEAPMIRIERLTSYLADTLSRAEMAAMIVEKMDRDELLVTATMADDAGY